MKLTELKQLIRNTLNEAFFIGEDKDIKCEKCGWEWKLADGGQYPYICHKCGFDNSYFDTETIDEYDVENKQDLVEFLQFIKEHNKMLAEANCNCVYEAEYHGHKVQLGKPMQGDIKKFKVYVKDPKSGRVVKVNFGAHGMNIKKNNPVRRKAYRARHNCDNPGPRTKANYWSCRKW
jgi:DNA-directed RNA polymerase subunit RPC12/RpoP